MDHSFFKSPAATKLLEAVRLFADGMNSLQEFLEGNIEDVSESVSEIVLPVLEHKIKPKKRIRDPNAPKLPLSAYLLFSRDKRVEFKETNADFESKDMMKEIARQWRELDLESKLKKTYLAEAEFLKQNYQIAQAEYEQSKVESNGDGPEELISGQDELHDDNNASDADSETVLPAGSDDSSSEDSDLEAVTKKAKLEAKIVAPPVIVPVIKKSEGSPKKKNKKKYRADNSPQLDTPNTKQKQKKPKTK